MSRRAPTPVLVVFVGWLCPGAGYAFIGEWRRAIWSGAAVLLLFIAGIAIGGIGVVDVPGYTAGGAPIRLSPEGITLLPGDRGYDEQRSILLTTKALGEVARKPWYVGQVLTGPVALAASSASIDVARAGYDTAKSRMYEIGMLYCSVAGVLNLLVLMDAGSRAARSRSITTTPVAQPDVPSTEGADE